MLILDKPTAVGALVSLAVERGGKEGLAFGGSPCSWLQDLSRGTRL